MWVPMGRSSVGPLRGREEGSQKLHFFEQEENFLLPYGPQRRRSRPDNPARGAEKTKLPRNRARKRFSSLQRIHKKRRWNGVRMSPTDPGHRSARTGFAAVKIVREATFALPSKILPRHIRISTPFFLIRKELGRLPPRKNRFAEWLELAAPQGQAEGHSGRKIGGLRQIKSPGEIAFLKEAIGFWTLDFPPRSHEADAARTLRISGGSKNGLKSTHGRLGSRGLRPIVWRRAPTSTALHYDKLSAQKSIKRPDIGRLGCRRAIRWLLRPTSRVPFPANGKFTPRQR